MLRYGLWKRSATADEKKKEKGSAQKSPADTSAKELGDQSATPVVTEPKPTVPSSEPPAKKTKKTPTKQQPVNIVPAEDHPVAIPVSQSAGTVAAIQPAQDQFRATELREAFIVNRSQAAATVRMSDPIVMESDGTNVRLWKEGSSVGMSQAERAGTADADVVRKVAAGEISKIFRDAVHITFINRQVLDYYVEWIKEEDRVLGRRPAKSESVYGRATAMRNKDMQQMYDYLKMKMDTKPTSEDKSIIDAVVEYVISNTDSQEQMQQIAQSANDMIYSAIREAVKDVDTVRKYVENKISTMISLYNRVDTMMSNMYANLSSIKFQKIQAIDSVIAARPSRNISLANMSMGKPIEGRYTDLVALDVLTIESNVKAGMTQNVIFGSILGDSSEVKYMIRQSDGGYPLTYDVLEKMREQKVSADSILSAKRRYEGPEFSRYYLVNARVSRKDIEWTVQDNVKQYVVTFDDAGIRLFDINAGMAEDYASKYPYVIFDSSMHPMRTDEASIAEVYEGHDTFEDAAAAIMNVSDMYNTTPFVSSQELGDTFYIVNKQRVRSPFVVEHDISGSPERHMQTTSVSETHGIRAVSSIQRVVTESKEEPGSKELAPTYDLKSKAIPLNEDTYSEITVAQIHRSFGYGFIPMVFGWDKANERPDMNPYGGVLFGVIVEMVEYKLNPDGSKAVAASAGSSNFKAILPSYEGACFVEIPEDIWALTRSVLESSGNIVTRLMNSDQLARYDDAHNKIYKGDSTAAFTLQKIVSQVMSSSLVNPYMDVRSILDDTSGYNVAGARITDKERQDRYERLPMSQERKDIFIALYADGSSHKNLSSIIRSPSVSWDDFGMYVTEVSGGKRFSKRVDSDVFYAELKSEKYNRKYGRQVYTFDIFSLSRSDVGSRDQHSIGKVDTVKLPGGRDVFIPLTNPKAMRIAGMPMRSGSKSAPKYIKATDRYRQQTDIDTADPFGGLHLFTAIGQLIKLAHKNDKYGKMFKSLSEAEKYQAAEVAYKNIYDIIDDINRQSAGRDIEYAPDDLGEYIVKELAQKLVDGNWSISVKNEDGSTKNYSVDEMMAMLFNIGGVSGDNRPIYTTHIPEYESDPNMKFNNLFAVVGSVARDAQDKLEENAQLLGDVDAGRLDKLKAISPASGEPPKIYFISPTETAFYGPMRAHKYKGMYYLSGAHDFVVCNKSAIVKEQKGSKESDIVVPNVPSVSDDAVWTVSASQMAVARIIESAPEAPDQGYTDSIRADMDMLNAKIQHIDKWVSEVLPASTENLGDALKEAHAIEKEIEKANLKKDTDAVRQFRKQLASVKDQYKKYKQQYEKALAHILNICNIPGDIVVGNLNTIDGLRQHKEWIEEALLGKSVKRQRKSGDVEETRDGGVKPGLEQRAKNLADYLETVGRPVAKAGSPERIILQAISGKGGTKLIYRSGNAGLFTALKVHESDSWFVNLGSGSNIDDLLSKHQMWDNIDGETLHIVSSASASEDTNEWSAKLVSSFSMQGNVDAVQLIEDVSAEVVRKSKLTPIPSIMADSLGRKSALDVLDKSATDYDKRKAQIDSIYDAKEEALSRWIFTSSGEYSIKTILESYLANLQETDTQTFNRIADAAASCGKVDTWDIKKIAYVVAMFAQKNMSLLGGILTDDPWSRNIDGKNITNSRVYWNEEVANTLCRLFVNLGDEYRSNDDYLQIMYEISKRAISRGLASIMSSESGLSDIMMQFDTYYDFEMSSGQASVPLDLVDDLSSVFMSAWFDTIRLGPDFKHMFINHSDKARFVKEQANYARKNIFSIFSQTPKALIESMLGRGDFDAFAAGWVRSLLSNKFIYKYLQDGKQIAKYDRLVGAMIYGKSGRWDPSISNQDLHSNLVLGPGSFALAIARRFDKNFNILREEYNKYINDKYELIKKIKSESVLESIGAKEQYERGMAKYHERQELRNEERARGVPEDKLSKALDPPEMDDRAKLNNMILEDRLTNVTAAFLSAFDRYKNVYTAKAPQDSRSPVSYAMQFGIGYAYATDSDVQFLMNLLQCFTSDHNFAFEACRNVLQDSTSLRDVCSVIRKAAANNAKYEPFASADDADLAIYAKAIYVKMLSDSVSSTKTMGYRSPLRDLDAFEGYVQDIMDRGELETLVSSGIDKLRVMSKNGPERINVMSIPMPMDAAIVKADSMDELLEAYGADKKPAVGQVARINSKDDEIHYMYTGQSQDGGWSKLSMVRGASDKEDDVRLILDDAVMSNVDFGLDDIEANKGRSFNSAYEDAMSTFHATYGGYSYPVVASELVDMIAQDPSLRKDNIKYDASLAAKIGQLATICRRIHSGGTGQSLKRIMHNQMQYLAVHGPKVFEVIGDKKKPITFKPNRDKRIHGIDPVAAEVMLSAAAVSEMFLSGKITGEVKGPHGDRIVEDIKKWYTDHPVDNVKIGSAYKNILLPPMLVNAFNVNTMSKIFDLLSTSGGVDMMYHAGYIRSRKTSKKFIAYIASLLGRRIYKPRKKGKAKEGQAIEAANNTFFVSDEMNSALDSAAAVLRGTYGSFSETEKKTLAGNGINDESEFVRQALRSHIKMSPDFHRELPALIESYVLKMKLALESDMTGVDAPVSINDYVRNNKCLVADMVGLSANLGERFGGRASSGMVVFSAEPVDLISYAQAAVDLVNSALAGSGIYGGLRWTTLDQRRFEMKKNRSIEIAKQLEKDESIMSEQKAILENEKEQLESEMLMLQNKYRNSVDGLKKLIGNDEEFVRVLSQLLQKYPGDAKSINDHMSHIDAFGGDNWLKRITGPNGILARHGQNIQDMSKRVVIAGLNSKKMRLSKDMDMADMHLSAIRESFELANLEERISKSLAEDKIDAGLVSEVLDRFSSAAIASRISMDKDVAKDAFMSAAQSDIICNIFDKSVGLSLSEHYKDAVKAKSDKKQKPGTKSKINKKMVFDAAQDINLFIVDAFDDILKTIENETAAVNNLEGYMDAVYRLRDNMSAPEFANWVIASYGEDDPSINAAAQMDPEETKNVETKLNEQMELAKFYGENYTDQQYEDIGAVISRLFSRWVQRNDVSDVLYYLKNGATSYIQAYDRESEVSKYMALLETPAALGADRQKQQDVLNAARGLILKDQNTLSDFCKKAYSFSVPVSGTVVELSKARVANGLIDIASLISSGDDESMSIHSRFAPDVYSTEDFANNLFMNIPESGEQSIGDHVEGVFKNSYIVDGNMYGVVEFVSANSDELYSGIPMALIFSSSSYTSVDPEQTAAAELMVDSYNRNLALTLVKMPSAEHPEQYSFHPTVKMSQINSKWLDENYQSILDAEKDAQRREKLKAASNILHTNSMRSEDVPLSDLVNLGRATSNTLADAVARLLGGERGRWAKKINQDFENFVVLENIRKEVVVDRDRRDATSKKQKISKEMWTEGAVSAVDTMAVGASPLDLASDAASRTAASSYSTTMINPLAMQWMNKEIFKHAASAEARRPDDVVKDITLKSTDRPQDSWGATEFNRMVYKSIASADAIVMKCSPDAVTYIRSLLAAADDITKSYVINKVLAYSPPVQVDVKNHTSKGFIVVSNIGVPLVNKSGRIRPLSMVELWALFGIKITEGSEGALIDEAPNNKVKLLRSMHFGKCKIPAPYYDVPRLHVYSASSLAGTQYQSMFYVDKKTYKPVAVPYTIHTGQATGGSTTTLTDTRAIVPGTGMGDRKRPKPLFRAEVEDITGVELQVFRGSGDQRRRVLTAMVDDVLPDGYTLKFTAASDGAAVMEGDRYIITSEYRLVQKPAGASEATPRAHNKIRILKDIGGTEHKFIMSLSDAERIRAAQFGLDMLRLTELAANAGTVSEFKSGIEAAIKDLIKQGKNVENRINALKEQGSLVKQMTDIILEPTYSVSPKDIKFNTDSVLSKDDMLTSYRLFTPFGAKVLLDGINSKDMDESGKEMPGTLLFKNEDKNHFVIVNRALMQDELGKSIEDAIELLSSSLLPRDRMAKLEEEISQLMQKVGDPMDAESLAEDIEKLNEDMKRVDPKSKMYELILEHRDHAKRKLENLSPVLEAHKLSLKINQLTNDMLSADRYGDEEEFGKLRARRDRAINKLSEVSPEVYLVYKKKQELHQLFNGVLDHTIQKIEKEKMDSAAFNAKEMAIAKNIKALRNTLRECESALITKMSRNEEVSDLKQSILDIKAAIIDEEEQLNRLFIYMAMVEKWRERRRGESMESIREFISSLLKNSLSLTSNEKMIKKQIEDLAGGPVFIDRIPDVKSISSIYHKRILERRYVAYATGAYDSCVGRKNPFSFGGKDPSAATALPGQESGITAKLRSEAMATVATRFANIILYNMWYGPESKKEKMMSLYTEFLRNEAFGIADWFEKKFIITMNKYAMEELDVHRVLSQAPGQRLYFLKINEDKLSENISAIVLNDIMVNRKVGETIVTFGTALPVDLFPLTNYRLRKQLMQGVIETSDNVSDQLKSMGVSPNRIPGVIRDIATDLNYEISIRGAVYDREGTGGAQAGGIGASAYFLSKQLSEQENAWKKKSDSGLTAQGVPEPSSSGTRKVDVDVTAKHIDSDLIKYDRNPFSSLMSVRGGLRLFASKSYGRTMLWRR